jgi:formylglycine-generating enzyme required for sulfatase activity
VSNIAWQDAALFCNWLSEKENLPKFYNVVGDRVTSINWDSNGYRLPTESEWSWVAKVTKAGSTKVFPWNSPSYPPPFVSGNYADESAKSMLPFTISNYNDSFPVSASVGSFQPNEKGIFNLSGNVAEWVNDFYEIRVNKSEPLVDYRGPNTGNRHVIRGASWALGSRSELRLSYREPGYDGKIDVGFRIARYVDKPKGDL